MAMTFNVITPISLDGLKGGVSSKLSAIVSVNGPIIALENTPGGTFEITWDFCDAQHDGMQKISFKHGVPESAIDIIYKYMLDY